MKFLRGGSVLAVLFNSFNYISSKVQDYHDKVRELYAGRVSEHHDCLTEYASDVLRKNFGHANLENHEVEHPKGTLYVVKSKLSERTYTVDLHIGHETCSCLRYYEKGIPCVHMILSLQKHSRVCSPEQSHGLPTPISEILQLTDLVYLASRLFKAFTTRVVFTPDPMGTYKKNVHVVLPERVKTKGTAPQRRRALGWCEPRHSKQSAGKHPEKT